jgi:hypothetical protein
MEDNSDDPKNKSLRDKSIEEILKQNISHPPGCGLYTMVLITMMVSTCNCMGINNLKDEIKANHPEIYVGNVICEEQKTAYGTANQRCYLKIDGQPIEQD